MEKSYFDSKSNVISKTLNLSNNYWLYSRKAKKNYENYVYENLQNYNPTNKRRALIAFDDMITDMESSEKIKSYRCRIVF